jgi:ketosteroid isomerase-like protein
MGTTIIEGTRMYAWCVKKVTSLAFSRLQAGDASFATALLADRVQFQFPGKHPFAAALSTKADSSEWFRRFAHFRPEFEIHDVIVSGMPWNMRAAIHFTDKIGGPDDVDAYCNEGVCLVRLRWGRVTQEKVFLDTQAVAEFFGTETPDEFFADVALEG